MGDYVIPLCSGFYTFTFSDHGADDSINFQAEQSNIMDWLLLIVAGVFEIVWATGLKYTEGFTRLWPSVLTILAMLVSFFTLAQAIRTVPLGTGYAIWTGIGAVGTAAVGIALFGESVSPARLGCIALVVVGIVGLKLTAG